MTTIEMSCNTCRYACKAVDEEPCKSCTRAYIDQWEPVTEEMKEWRKQAIDDFITEALKHIPCYKTSGTKVRKMLRDIQTEI